MNIFRKVDERETLFSVMSWKLLKISSKWQLCRFEIYFFCLSCVSISRKRTYTFSENARTHARPPHIFFLDCPWSAAPTNCIVKGDRRWQETARFFLLEIAPFGTPKARLKNIPRPKIVVQRATLSTVLDDDAVWRWQVSLAPAERLTFPFLRFAASPFHLSIYIIHCFSNLSYRGQHEMQFHTATRYIKHV